MLIEIQKQLSKVRLHNAIIQATQSVIACICIYPNERFILKKQFHTNPIRSDKMSMKFTQFGYSPSGFSFIFEITYVNFFFESTIFFSCEKIVSKLIIGLPDQPEDYHIYAHIVSINSH